MRQVIGIHLGASFAEACAFDGHSISARTQWYLPRQPLRTTLPKWLEENSLKPEALFISTRSLERIFDFRMGGTTAQIVTRGLERWPFLNGTGAGGFFRAQAPLAICSSDLCFGVDERVSAEGRVEKPLSLESLGPIAEKLKLQQIKKICVHLLHAGKNPVHENLAADFLEKEGFEVFRPTHGGDENADWRANTLDASLSGSMEELRADIEKAVEGLPLSGKIFFATGHGDWVWDRKDRRLSILFGADRLLRDEGDGESTAILDFGWESWRLLRPDRPTARWKSPWGPVHQPSLERVDFFLQPTQALRLEPGGFLGLADKSEGYEPGPLSLGRGQKPLVVDLLGEKMLADWSPPNAGGRVNSALQALVKSSEEAFRDVSEMSSRLHRGWGERLNRELWMAGPWKALRARGRFAPLWTTALRSVWKESLHVDESTDAERVARAGFRETSR